MITPDAAFVAKIRGQIVTLRDPEYAYDEFRVYVAGIAEPWAFGRADEFEFDRDELLTVRVGPVSEHDNAGVPEHVFPLRHVVATELAVREG